MTEPAIDGTAVDVTPETDGDQPSTGQVLARTQAQQQTSGALAVTPQADAAELVARLDVIRDAMDSAMKDGIDYGRIPGVSKPTLLKPGAEKLGVLFQLDVQLDNRKEWGPGDHLTVNSHATVYHAPTGTRLGFGEGLCTTRERKYAKRKMERTCPQCGVAAIIKGKAEYGGGWVCFKKKDGCGAKFPDGDVAIEGQQVGEIDNPDLPDAWNTVIKMAEKRARVDAILAVTGASALFTQDVEDSPAAAAAESAPAALPDWAAVCTPAQREQFVSAAAQLLGDPTAAAAMADALEQRCGHLPALAVMLLRPIAKRVTEARASGSDLPWDGNFPDAPDQGVTEAGDTPAAAPCPPPAAAGQPDAGDGQQTLDAVAAEPKRNGGRRAAEPAHPTTAEVVT